MGVFAWAKYPCSYYTSRSCRSILAQHCLYRGSWSNHQNNSSSDVGIGGSHTADFWTLRAGTGRSWPRFDLSVVSFSLYEASYQRILRRRQNPAPPNSSYFVAKKSMLRRRFLFLRDFAAICADKDPIRICQRPQDMSATETRST